MRTLAKIQVPTETPRFNERKATEAGVQLILASGGRQSLVTLLSMLFLADRRLIAQIGVGLTDDEYVGIEGVLAVPFGLASHAAKLTLFSSPWHQHIECHPDESVKVLAPIKPAVLSHLEATTVEAVGRDYIQLDDEAFVRRFLNEAPEVAQLGQVHFTMKEVLTSLGYDSADAEEAYEDWASLRRTRYPKSDTAR